GYQCCPDKTKSILNDDRFMPNIAAAKKYLKQSSARRLRNRMQRSVLRNRIKGFRTLMEAGTTQEEADKQFALVVKCLDQSAAKNLIHANVASRTKSRLAALKKKTLS
ncbi:MAG: 30S ribosomal protein S20, partial [Fuerstiella sp.]